MRGLAASQIRSPRYHEAQNQLTRYCVYLLCEYNLSGWSISIGLFRIPFLFQKLRNEVRNVPVTDLGKLEDAKRTRHRYNVTAEGAEPQSFLSTSRPYFGNRFEQALFAMQSPSVTRKYYQAARRAVRVWMYVIRCRYVGTSDLSR
jgi:hypothetical protein